MVTTTLRAPRALFRDRAGAMINSCLLLYIGLGWLGSFALMAAPAIALNVLGVLLCLHCMVLAAYLIHDAAHQNIFTTARANLVLGEAMNFIAGSSYASFERIRHMHIRHHRDRADLTCFDFRRFLQRHPLLCRVVQALEWAYIPAAETLMHSQVIWRPFLEPSQRQHLPRVLAMLALRAALLALLGWWSLKALLLYFVAALVVLHVLNFFDAFHHSFPQYFVAANEAVPMDGRDSAYEQKNTYSNLISRRHPWMNLLTLNFGHHNAHHQRPSIPWYRLPALHRDLFGKQSLAVLPLSELLFSWHRHRVLRVTSDDYGGPTEGPGRADQFVGAHGVSFLTVV